MNKSFSPRPASEEDLEQVVKIEAYCNRPPWSHESFRAELKKEFSNFWVLSDDESDQQVIAYAVFSFDGKQAHLQTLGVDREFRRKGHGKKFLRYLINYVLRKKGESIYLELRKSNTAALALYQSLGFVVIRNVKNLYPDGEDAFAMLFKMVASKIPSSEKFAIDEEDGETGAGSKKNFN